ncbi:sulfatase-like hydrolase/transferase [Photobacterium leiognathi]|uniref:sulfatase-like hydrolase/transferase n=1 Tax=Photobacterium leiognathi TaxID=553611 RepID=UPI0029814E6E|nr:sulfatase-like hydrolase/transferase [Photobacterium leiognathi]
MKLQWIFATLVLTLLGCNSNTPDNTIQKAQPPLKNIILVYADDLGIGQLGAYGQTKIQTPHFDQLASQGLKFNAFYSSGAFCPPSRNSLLTGLHTGESQWKSSADIFGEEETIADRLKQLGYDTSVFGKWGMSHSDAAAAEYIQDSYPLCSNLTQDDMLRVLPEEFTDSPIDAGFDTFVGFMQHRDAHVHYHDSPDFPEESTPSHPYYTNIRQDLYQLVGNEVKRYKTTPAQYLPDVVMDNALSHLEKVKDKPFFMYIASTLPHAELAAPPETKALYQQNGKSIFPEIPFTGNHVFYRHVAEPRAELAGMITRFDQHLGQLVTKLEQLGIAEETLIIVSSDNGPHSAGGIINNAFFQSAGKYRDGKWTLYEGGIRVPTLMYYKGMTPEVINQSYSQYQLKDTVIEIASGQPTSRSLAPLLQQQSVQPEDYLYWQHYYFKSNTPLYDKPHTLQAVRMGDLKLLRIEPGFDTTTPRYGSLTSLFELYHLADDPSETTNLIGSYCTEMYEMITIMNNYATAENNIEKIKENDIPPCKI